MDLKIFRSGSQKYDVVSFPEHKPRQKSELPLREEIASEELKVLGDLSGLQEL